MPLHIVSVFEISMQTEIVDMLARLAILVYVLPPNPSWIVNHPRNSTVQMKTMNLLVYQIGIRHCFTLFDIPFCDSSVILNRGLAGGFFFCFVFHSPFCLEFKHQNANQINYYLQSDMAFLVSKSLHRYRLYNPLYLFAYIKLKTYIYIYIYTISCVTLTHHLS